MFSEALVSLSPKETLSFDLEKDISPKAILRVTNISQNKVVFKVKTTQPTWYYVRPNQHVLNVGQTEEVVIVLIQSECSRYLERAAEDKADKLDKHRFLVQTKAIEDEDYEKIVSATAEQRIDAYMRVWDGASKDERKNFKLKVEYNYPELGSPQKNRKSLENTGDEKDNVTKENDIKSNIRKLEKKRVDEEEESNPENATSDYLNLKTKYSNLVEYTVCLVAERDTIARRLEESDRDLARENARKKDYSVAGSDTQKIRKVEKLIFKGKSPKGFSLTVVIIAAVAFLLIGRYFKS